MINDYDDYDEFLDEEQDENILELEESKKPLLQDRVTVKINDGYYNEDLFYLTDCKGTIECEEYLFATGNIVVQKYERKKGDFDVVVAKFEIGYSDRVEIYVDAVDEEEYNKLVNTVDYVLSRYPKKRDAFLNGLCDKDYMLEHEEATEEKKELFGEVVLEVICMELNNKSENDEYLLGHDVYDENKTDDYFKLNCIRPLLTHDEVMEQRYEEQLKAKMTPLEFERYKRNITARIGDICICPYCGQLFVKNRTNQYSCNKRGVKKFQELVNQKPEENDESNRTKHKCPR